MVGKTWIEPALVGDLTAVHMASISTTGYDLTLSAYTAGARWQPRLGHTSSTRLWQPFGQLLMGMAHASGKLASPASNAAAAFAVNLGGGVDLRANRRFSVRLIEADYLLTTFDNGLNDHQNNLRLGTGVVIRFRQREMAR